MGQTHPRTLGQDPGNPGTSPGFLGPTGREKRSQGPFCAWFLEAENGSQGTSVGWVRVPLQSMSYCYFAATVGELLLLTPLHSLESGIFEGCPNEVGYRNSMSETDELADEFWSSYQNDKIVTS